MSPFARPDLFWSTERVAARLDDRNVRIVDCLFSSDADARTDYLKAHLPGAVHIDWSRDIAAPPPASGHPAYMLQEPAAFAATMARFGIGDDTLVIGYDAEGGHHAARLWLALRRYGHDAMAVMEGGIQ
ncbi:MAG TPA: rhodanese-like domain-containing protein, partial [Candidatus Limnocylindria bacterium]|nr:rhodanese-like domain-containing protein [Candidatus Limnocylindria bacterium]